VNEFSVSISTGNCFGLQRTQSDVVEAIEIVSNVAEAPHIYDSFAFVATDMRESMPEVPDEFQDELLIGTSTMSCFTWRDELVGGLLVSLPWSSSSSIDVNSFFESYKFKFGDALLETVRERPSFTSANQIDNISSEEIGLTGKSIDVFESGPITIQGTSVEVFGFLSEETINFLYLISEGKNEDITKYQSIVRQLDTLTVFESPKSSKNVIGSIWVPCSRVLSSARFQSYIESSYELSKGTHLNLGSLDSPQIYMDSVLDFTISPEFTSKVSVEIIGSRNTSEIERNVRQMTKSVTSIETTSFTTIESAVIGQKQDGEGEVVIGELYVDWACSCESNVCPSIVIAHSESKITTQTLTEIDTILNEEITGQDAIEITLGELVIDATAVSDK
jgi:hypothetical protein